MLRVLVTQSLTLSVVDAFVELATTSHGVEW
jgi:hypothetical protein